MHLCPVPDRCLSTTPCEVEVAANRGANAQSWKTCVIAQDLDDLAYYAEGKQVAPKEYGEYFGKCTTRGATVGLNFQAKSDSRVRTKAIVAKVFGLQ